MQVLSTILVLQQVSLKRECSPKNEDPVFFSLSHIVTNLYETNNICIYSYLSHTRHSRTNDVWRQTCCDSWQAQFAHAQMRYESYSRKDSFSLTKLSFGIDRTRHDRILIFIPLKRSSQCSANQIRTSIFHQLTISKCAVVCEHVWNGTTSISVTWDG